MVTTIRDLLFELLEADDLDGKIYIDPQLLDSVGVPIVDQYGRALSIKIAAVEHIDDYAVIRGVTGKVDRE